MMKVSAEVLRLQVLVKGKPVQEYRGPGNNIFIEGKHGSVFELEITNLTPRRVLVHPTVDGLSTMTGKLASANDSSAGYVLRGCQTMRVPGWRLDNDNIAKFYFAGAENSYAEQVGQGAHKGVIACPVWEEAQSWLFSTTNTHAPIRSGSSSSFTSCVGHIRCSRGLPVIPDCYKVNDNTQVATAYCCQTGETQTNTNIAGAVQNLGTGFGKQAHHSVVTTSFIPASNPACTAIIYYDTIDGLKARGININKKVKHQLPNPFPKDQGCPPPPGWRG